jgi:uncharacterized protein YbaR (Trm112 family)
MDENDIKKIVELTHDIEWSLSNAKPVNVDEEKWLETTRNIIDTIQDIGTDYIKLTNGTEKRKQIICPNCKQEIGKDDFDLYKLHKEFDDLEAELICNKCNKTFELTIDIERRYTTKIGYSTKEGLIE